MKDNKEIHNFKDMEDSLSFLINEIDTFYWSPLLKYLKENPSLQKTFTTFLFHPEQIVIYMGKTHLAIEYFGKETAEEFRDPQNLKVLYYDYSQNDENFFDLIVGFKYDGTAVDFRLPLPAFSDEWVLPTNAGIKKLTELKWNFSAQNSIIGINTCGLEPPEGQFCRIVNGLFFDADESGLKTRHIKWIDFIPVKYDDKSSEVYDTFVINFNYLKSLVEHDAHYVYPLPPKDEFKYSKLPQINRFIELIGNSSTTEPQITKFLEQNENKFILTMGFLAKEIVPQCLCDWQSENKESIKPDFFVVRPNGFADIVEFKLPFLKNNDVVGKNNRETFSAEINSYISQTRVYRTYFEDPNNRRWVENKYNLKINYPKRVLIVGRRWDFPSDEWKSILNDYRDIELMTYDDLVDGVVAQFYM